MADNKKVYSISINGVKESISEVDSLISKIQYLDQRIQAMSRNTNINVKASGGGASASQLQEQDKVLKEIYTTEQKIEQVRSEQYQSLLASKEALKEAKNDAEQLAAAERLTANAYSNTMASMKQQLADLKRLMNTTDISDAAFGDMVKQANELTTKLRELEMSYGQFGRNVGNYTSAFDEFKKIQVTVGDTTREFNNVREATRTLNNELKAMVLNGQQDTEQFKQLSEAVHNFEMGMRRAESAMNDLKKSSQVMDDLMDTAESFVALGQVSKGFSAIFGFDDNEIQKSIQKLVALQSVLQGIEKIRQQMNTEEGIGKILARGNTFIDQMISKITAARVTTEGLTMSSRAATVAVRGLSLALKAIGVGLVIGGITLIANMLSRVAERANYGAVQMSAFEDRMKVLNNQLQRNRDIISSNYLRGYISDNEFLTKQYEAQNDALAKQIDLLRDMASSSIRKNQSFLGTFDSENADFLGGRLTGTTEISENSFFPWIKGLRTTVSSIDEVEKKWKMLDKAVRDGKDAWDAYGKGVSGYLKSLVTTLTDTQTIIRGLGNIRLSDFLEDYKDVANAFNSGKISAEQYAAKIKELVNIMNSNEVLNSVILNLDKYIPDEAVRNAVNSVIGEINRLNDAMQMNTPQQVHHWNQVRIEGMKDGWAKTKAQIEEERRYEIQQNGYTQEQIALINQKYRRKEIEARKSYAKEVRAVDNELSRLRIENMRDGLDKQLALLEQERKEKIQKAQENERRVGELTLEINKEYDKKILDAKREWAYNVQKVYTDIWTNIFKINRENMEAELDNELKRMGNNLRDLQDKAQVLIPTSVSNYRQPQVVNEKYDVYGKKIKDTSYDKESYKLAEQYLFLLEKIDAAKTRLGERQLFGKKENQSIEEYNQELAHLKGTLDKNEAALKDFLDVYASSQDAFEKMSEVQELRNNSFTTNLALQFDTRISATKQYYWVLNDLSKQYINETLETEKQKLDIAMNDELRTLKNGYAQEDKEIEDHYRKGELTLEQYNEITTRLTQERASKEAAILDKYAKEKIRVEQEALKEAQQSNATMHSNILNEFRSFYDNLASQDTQIYTKLGFLNVPQTVNRNRELKAAYSNLSNELTVEFTKLRIAFEMKEIDLSTYENLKRELNTILTTVNNTLRQLQQESKDIPQTVAQMINQYVQAFGQALNTVISSLTEIQSNKYDEQIEDLQDFIDKYEEELNKLSDIIQEHSDKVNDIEDELKTARGDRRQALIDQLNAEKIAQRQALAEEKRIAKEKEKAEERQRKLKNEQAKAQHKADVAQAIINAAMAVSMAAVNKWPLPAIPMMALAAAAGAAQIAAVSSAKVPQYADGGVIQGKSHSQGGVKVLGGYAEVEGREFITNKYTTSKNQDLLYYINSKRKKLSLDDFVEFYSNGKVANNVSNVTHKFADGGTLPTITTNINMGDRLLSAFEDYSNRPVIVQTVDIIDRIDNIREVQVLAGLS